VKVSDQQPTLGGEMTLGNIVRCGPPTSSAARNVCLNERGRGRERALPVTTSVSPTGVPAAGNHGIFWDRLRSDA
jgi:hypothetical protein